MNKENSHLVDKISDQHIKSIAREIAGHSRILDQAIRKNDATKLQKAYLPLLRLYWKIKTEINSGLLEVSCDLQEILTISRQQINDLQILSRLNPLNIQSILASISEKTTYSQPASYRSALSHDIQLNILEYSNLNSMVALSCTCTWLWDILNSKDVAYIWKELAGIYFSHYLEEDNIDSMKKFKRAFLNHYKWQYTLSDDSDKNPDYKKSDSYYEIKRKGLLFTKSVEGGLISALKSNEFKINFKINYADPLAFYMKDAEAKSGICSAIPAEYSGNCFLFISCARRSRCSE